jgi:MFS family permease
MKILSKEFNALFWTQFFGALNDNVFKNALMILITYQGINLFGLNSNMLVAFSGGLFILPFFIFSAISAEISKKYERIEIVKWVKIFEVFIMLIASIGIFVQNYHLLFVVLFMLGIHSTVFGPLKYSLIPEFVKEEKLVLANALISAGTFIAILLGTILGGVLATGAQMIWLLKFVLLLISGLGVYASRKLPRLSIENSNHHIDWSFRRSTLRILKMVFHDKEVFSLLFGLSWFWFLGAGILSLVPASAKDVFHAKESVATCMLFVFTIGMGSGPFLLERVSKGKIHLQIIPICLFLMSLFIFDTAFVINQIEHQKILPNIFETINLNQFFEIRYSYRFLTDLFLISFFGGIFTVSQYSELQRIVDKTSLSQVIAGNNILNALFMVMVSLLIMVLHKMNLNLAVIFGIVGILNIGACMLLVFFHKKEFENWWSF